MRDVDLPSRFGLAALATWRLAHLLAEEDGPGSSIARLRGRAGAGAAGELMDCFYCLSLWLAAPLAFYVTGRRRETAVTWAALSGAACLLERSTRERGAWDVLWEEPEGGRRGGVEPGAGSRAREAAPAAAPA